MAIKITRKRSALSRRHFLQHVSLGAAALVPSVSATRANTDLIPDSWKTAGSEFSNYGQPLDIQDMPIRWISTPNGLHFERHHNGIPAIDVQNWQLQVHGHVDHALGFDLESLKRYPLQSRTVFIECGGNSNSMWHPNPVQAPSGYVHGLVSCSEWTGVALSTLLNEAGLKSDASWLIAQGYDSSNMSLSLPIDKIMDDCFIALYQNGEPIRLSNGYPARLIVPGWEGVTHVKWLRSLHLVTEPAMTKFDTVSYTDLKLDGTADRFSYPMAVKSVITSPTAGMALHNPGFYEIRGLAWSGKGHIKRVEISTDGGGSWEDAELQQPILDQSLTRFRKAWNWNGESNTVMSRATDSMNESQILHSALLAAKGGNHYYHYNAIVAWRIGTDGRIQNVYS